MAFGSPWMLFGLLAAGVPVVIHLIGRRRAAVRPFAAFHFLMRSNRKLARRLRVRQILLLMVRTALVAGLVLVAAKPTMQVVADLPAMGSGAQSVVLLVDDTLSMQRVLDGLPLFVRAKQKAREVVRLLGAQADVAVLSVVHPDGPLATLTRNRRRVVAALDGLNVTYRHATLGAALSQAIRLLESSALPERRIFVISDMAKHGLTDALPPVPANVEIRPLNVAGTAPTDNLSATDLRVEPSPAPGRYSMAITARVCSFAKRPVEALLDLKVDGQAVARGELRIDAQQCAEKLFHHAFARAGAHEVAVSLPADVLLADNTRFARAEVRGEIRVLLVDGSPSPVRYRDELFYLHTALQTQAEGAQPLSNTVVREDDLQAAQIGAFDVVALCNVRHLEAKQLSALVSFVRRGGGLLIALGDRVDAARYNRELGALLPQPLRDRSSAAADGERGVLRLAPASTEHPVLAAIWSQSTGAGLRRARFREVFRLAPVVDSARRVVLRFDDGAPALVEARRGAGRVMLFVSTIDRDWNDLPIRPGYLPLMQQIVRYLARVPISDEASSALLVGSSRSLPVPRDAKQLRLVGPDGAERLWSAPQLEGRQHVSTTIELPGFYRVAAQTRSKARWAPQPGFVANVDPRESDLTRGSLRRGPGDSSRPATAARGHRPLELWHGLGLALLALLVFEGYLLRRG